MTSGRIKWALFGGGPESLIGRVHRIAAGDDFQLVGGVFSSNLARSQAIARNWQLDASRVRASLDEFIACEMTLPRDRRIQAATIATPNHLHYGMATRLVDAGIHVICEKPITLSASEASSLATQLASGKVVFAVAHTYTGYPMVRQMRAMIGAGSLGTLQRIDVQYYQGWVNPLIHDPVLRRGVWRFDPLKGGSSLCVGDVGVHAFNLVEYTTGLDVNRVLEDVDTLYEDNPLDVDASILIRTNQSAKGVIRLSQIATAEENNLQIMVYGRRGGLKWAQENPNRLEFLEEGKPAAVYTPGHAFDAAIARDASTLPPGHPEGFIEAMTTL